jgi:DNA-binding transcriptional LysR family regulator
MIDKLRAMVFFCRAAEAKNFAAAAQVLEVVPSALSKVIAALEKELGFVLMNRSTRRISLTDEGTLYYEQCRQILADVEAAEQLGGCGALQVRGVLRVGMHPGLRFAMLTRLGSFLDVQPRLTVETVITNSASAVIDEGLDLVLHIGRLSDSSLIAKPIGWTRPVVCASADYLTRWGLPKHPSELSKHRAIIYARRDETSNTRWTFTKDNRICEVDVPVGGVSRDGIGLVDAALGGCGIARPFDVAARHLIDEGKLQEIFPDWTGEREAITAVLPPHGRLTSAKVRLYLEHMVQVLGGAESSLGALK